MPGWTASDENIAKIKQAIETKSADSAGFVLDLLGNSSARFDQFDGTTALPFRSKGKFHLGGKVTITPPEVLKKTGRQCNSDF